MSVRILQIRHWYSVSEFTYASGALFCVFLTPDPLGDRDDIAAALTTEEMKSLGSGSGSRVLISLNPLEGTSESALLASERGSEAKPGLIACCNA